MIFVEGKTSSISQGLSRDFLINLVPEFRAFKWRFYAVEERHLAKNVFKFEFWEKVSNIRLS